MDVDAVAHDSIKSALSARSARSAKSSKSLISKGRKSVKRPESRYSARDGRRSTPSMISKNDRAEMMENSRMNLNINKIIAANIIHGD